MTSKFKKNHKNKKISISCKISEALVLNCHISY